MFKRKKIHSELDTYIHRRYEDLAVCIHYDIKNGRGTYSYYAPWLEAMLQRLPSAQLREKYSLMTQHQLQKASTAWGEHQGTMNELCTGGRDGLTVGRDGLTVGHVPEAILENEEGMEEKYDRGLTEGDDRCADATALEAVGRTEDTQLVHKEGIGGSPNQNQTLITGRSRICVVL